ncbi:MAG: DUF4287 domain-containing protein [Planctomycetota bacterium]
MASSPDDMLQSMIDNLAAKTGKDLAAWLRIAEKGGDTHGAIVKFLKGEHGLTHGYANLVAQRTLEKRSGGPASAGDLVAVQYAGPRAALKPIHDALVAAARKLGRDVVVDAKKTGVSLRRGRQFALIQPATNTRIDLGLRLDLPLGGRLEKWPNTMCTHRVRLSSVADVDREVLGWLEQSYAAAE